MRRKRRAQLEHRAPDHRAGNTAPATGDQAAAASRKISDRDVGEGPLSDAPGSGCVLATALAAPLASPLNVLLRSAPTLAERHSLMRPVTSLMIVCLSACGTSPAPEQAWDEQDNRGGQQAQLDAQAIMAGMDQARIRAALLARMGR